MEYNTAFQELCVQTQKYINKTDGDLLLSDLTNKNDKFKQPNFSLHILHIYPLWWYDVE